MKGIIHGLILFFYVLAITEMLPGILNQLVSVLFQRKKKMMVEWIDHIQMAHTDFLLMTLIFIWVVTCLDIFEEEAEAKTLL